MIILYNFFSPRSHYFAKFAVSNLSEDFQLNASTLEYCDFKIFYSYLQHYLSNEVKLQQFPGTA